VYQKNPVMHARFDTAFGGTGSRARSCNQARRRDTGERRIAKGVSNPVHQPLIELAGGTAVLIA
jgi:hypothetical protein